MGPPKRGRETTFGYADRIFYELKNAEMSVRELTAMKRGTIRLGVGATTLTYRLPKVLWEFKRSYPDIELIAITATTESLLKQVASQEVDLAIVMQVSQHSWQRVDHSAGLGGIGCHSE